MGRVATLRDPARLRDQQAIQLGGAVGAGGRVDRAHSWPANPSPLRSLASYIRQQTGSGREIVDFQLQVMRGEPILIPDVIRKKAKNGSKRRELYVQPTLDQRREAAAWIADRGWGKAKEILEVTGDAGPAERLALLRRLSNEQLDQLGVLFDRMLEGKPQESNAGVITVESNSNEPKGASGDVRIDAKSEGELSDNEH